MLLNVALAEISGSTVEKGGVAGAEFSADVTFSQWFCFLINACSSLQSLLCLFERNTALQPRIQGNLGDLYVKNPFRLKVAIPFQRVHSANSVCIPLSRKIIGPNLYMPATHTQTLHLTSIFNIIWHRNPPVRATGKTQKDSKGVK